MSDKTQKTVVAKFESDTKNYDQGLKKMDAENKKVDKSTTKLNSSIESMNENLAETINQAGILPGKLGGVVSGLTKVTAGFKGMRLAIAATGIGALLIALVSLAQYFTRSAEGQEKFLVITKTVGAFVGRLIDSFINLGKAIVSVFESPKKAFDDFKKVFVDFFESRVELARKSVINLIGAFDKLFSGDFSGAVEDFGEGFIEINRAINPVAISLELLVETGKELGTVLDESIDIAQKGAEIQRQRNQLVKDELAFTLEKAQIEARIEDLKKDAANTELSRAQRQQAITEATRLQNQISQEAITLANTRARLLEEEQALGSNTLEDNEELVQAKIVAFNVQKESALKLREMQGTQMTLTREAQAEAKARQDAADALNRQLNDFKETSLEDIELPEVTGVPSVETYSEQVNKLLSVEERFQKEREEIRKASLDYVEEQNRIEAENYEALAANQVDVAGQTAGALASLAEEGSGAQKAFAIIEALINTYKGISVAIGSAVPPLNFILAGITAAAGFANVSKIANTELPPKPKFAMGGIVPARTGGMIVGQSHASGGVVFGIGNAAEAEGGEFIVNRRATAMHLPLLRSINKAGLRKYANGGQVLQGEQARVMNEIKSAGASSRSVLVVENYREVSNRIDVIENLSKV